MLNNGCEAESSQYDLGSCVAFQGGLLSTSGLRGGVLRFSTVVRDLAEQLDAGAIRGTNSSAAAAALARGDTAGFVSIVGGPSGSLQNSTSILHSTLFPNVLGISEAIAAGFREQGTELHEGALTRSRALTIVLIVFMVLGAVLWIWPSARQLGRDVFSTHALVAAIPSDVALRVPRLRKVLQRIARLASEADSQDDEKLTELDNLAGINDFELGDEAEENAAEQPQDQQ